jgi:hypothetical protein
MLNKIVYSWNKGKDNSKKQNDRKREKRESAIAPANVAGQLTFLLGWLSFLLLNVKCTATLAGAIALSLFSLFLSFCFFELSFPLFQE